jgi:hypothetical protein
MIRIRVVLKVWSEPGILQHLNRRALLQIRTFLSGSWFFFQIVQILPFYEICVNFLQQEILLKITYETFLWAEKLTYVFSM